MVITLAFFACASPIVHTIGNNTDTEQPTEPEPEITPPGAFDFLNFTRAEGDLIVHFMDVGQGDGIFIEFPDGKRMIMDGGSLIFSPSAYILSYLSHLTINNGVIDYLMLTHADRDHCNGLDAVIKNYTINSFYVPKLTPSQVDTGSYSDFYAEMMKETNAQINYNIDILEIIGEGYKLTLYCRSEGFYSMITPKTDSEIQNQISPIAILEYADRKVVFTGDADFSSEDFFMSLAPFDSIDCDVLKVGHHGSKSSTSEAFLEFISPEYAVISVGAIDIIHPQKQLLDRLKARNITTMRTDKNGAVVLRITQQGDISFVCKKP
ncbi:MAG: MBL fold metallo-hydrolase [Clostridia bacterium]|nr:MBL fold metallo-hydrolase [Clostridia bacterium]